MEKKLLYEPILVRELPFQIIPEDIDENVYKNAGLEFLIILQYQDNYNVVGLHSALRFISQDKKPIVSGGVTVVAKLDDMPSEEINEEILRSLISVKQLLAYAHAFMSGVFFKQSQGTVFNKAIIPCMTADELLEYIKIEKKKG